MKHLLLFLAIFLACRELAGQNTIPLLGNDNLTPNAKGESIMGSEKFKIADAVYQKLVEARGDSRYQTPKFVMTKAAEDGAKMDYDSLEITLEERAYDVCASFGAQRDAALAIILGHELTHYYEKHGWRRGFANEYRQLNIGMKLDGVQDDVIHETQADYLGGFLAYSAGYGLFDKCPDLIQALYKAYKLPDTLTKYAVRQDREAMSRFTIKKLELLVDAFETANLMTAIGHYDEARVYYQYVLRDYQSREIYNNIGVTTLLEVLENVNQKFLYPVELDLNSRHGRGSGAGWGDGDTKRLTLLNSAIKNFDAAINMDPGYAPAYLNKACALALLNDLTRAQFYAEIEAKQAAKANNFPKTESDANILLGIIADMNRDTSKARKLFETEAKKPNELAAKNLRILLRQSDEAADMSPLTQGTSSFAGISKPEKIDSISLADFAENLHWDKDRTQKIDEKRIFFQYQIPNKASKIYICRDGSGDSPVLSFFQITKPTYTGKTSKGIGIGDKKQAIVDAYKNPVRTVETPRGNILVYKSLIFILDADGKLVQWVNYRLP